MEMRVQTDIEAPNGLDQAELLYAAIPFALIGLLINSMRHPQRSFVSAPAIFAAGVLLVPLAAFDAFRLHVHSGGAPTELLVILIGLAILGFWGIRRWIKSPPRSARRRADSSTSLSANQFIFPAPPFHAKSGRYSSANHEHAWNV